MLSLPRGTPPRALIAFVSAGLTAIGVAACGAGVRTPSAVGLPLPSRVHVTLSLRVCNPGANSFCALELVVRGSGYRTPLDLLGAEQAALARRGWAAVNAPNGFERSADSPSGERRITFATEGGELKAIHRRWITRAARVTEALAVARGAHAAALSVLLQVGTT